MQRNRRSLRGTRVIAAAGVIAIGCVLAACGGSSSTSSSGSGSSGGGSSGKVVQAKFSLAQNVNTPLAETVTKFDNLVKQYTNGTVNIKLYANSVLGTQEAQLEGVENNTIQFQATGSGLDGIVPAFDLTALPFLFPSAQVAEKVLDDPNLDAPLWNNFQSKGLHYIGMYEVGFSDFLSKTPVNSASDFKGKIVRVFDAKLGAEEYRLVGADAVNLSSTDVVTGLQTGTINAADDPPSTFYASDWYSEAKDIAIMNMTYAADPMMVSQKFWNSLSSSQQAAITKAFQQTVQLNISSTAAYNNTALQKMQAAGVKITHPSISQLKTAFHPVYSSFGGKYQNVLSVMQKDIAQYSGS